MTSVFAEREFVNWSSIDTIQEGKQKTIHLQKGHSCVVPKNTRHRVCVKEFANLIVIDGISPL